MRANERFLDMKVDLARRLLATEDEVMVRKIAELMGEPFDWWDELSDDQKAAVDRAEVDMAAGRVHAHEEIETNVKEWLKG
jgi:hypothetical protein